MLVYPTARGSWKPCIAVGTRRDSRSATSVRAWRLGRCQLGVFSTGRAFLCQLGGEERRCYAPCQRLPADAGRTLSRLVRGACHGSALHVGTVDAQPCGRRSPTPATPPTGLDMESRGQVSTCTARVPSRLARLQVRSSYPVWTVTWVTSRPDVGVQCPRHRSGHRLTAERGILFTGARLGTRFAARGRGSVASQLPFNQRAGGCIQGPGALQGLYPCCATARLAPRSRRLDWPTVTRSGSESRTEQWRIEKCLEARSAGKGHGRFRWFVVR
jgi:hypothetical protein